VGSRSFPGGKGGKGNTERSGGNITKALRRAKAWSTDKGKEANQKGKRGQPKRNDSLEDNEILDARKGQTNKKQRSCSRENGRVVGERPNKNCKNSPNRNKD